MGCEAELRGSGPAGGALGSILAPRLERRADLVSPGFEPGRVPEALLAMRLV